MTERDLELDAEWSARLTLDDRGGPARRLAKGRALAMVEQALDAAALSGGAQPPAASAVEVGTERAGARKAALVRGLASAAIVLLALAGSAFAALRYLAPAPQRAAGVMQQLPRQAVAPKAAVAAPVELVQPAPPAAAALSAVAADPGKRARPAPLHDEPDDLLQAANRLRAQGRFGAAAEVYALVYERHPRSITAYTAQVAGATIELEHRGNARLARTLFSHALRRYPGGALDIEVRQGLSLALRDLGDVPAETQALRGLLAAHPDSPAAERARARLRELGVQLR